MSTTPRKSSLRSNHTTRSNYPRLPASLRVPSGRIPTPSAASLSLIFASHESSGPTSGPTSEEALAKQLDGDAGGRTMGLRSRRGSSATARSRRTHSGVSASSVPEETGEEVEGERPVAGPSSPRAVLVESPINSPVDEGPAAPAAAQRLNPKSSSSWMRWNSPAPSFPRSVSRDKGKGKEREGIQGSCGDVRGDRTQTEPATMVDSDSAPVEESPTREGPSVIEEDASRSATTTSADTPAIPPPNRGRWWSRAAPSSTGPTALDSAIPQNPTPAQLADASVRDVHVASPAALKMPAAATKETSPVRLTAPSGTSHNSILTSVATAPQYPKQSDQPEHSAHTETTIGATSDSAKDPQASQHTTQSTSSWLGYLGKGKQTPASSGTPAAKETTQEDPRPAAEQQLPVQQESSTIVEPNPEQEAGDVTASPQQKSQSEADVQAVAPPKTGWGSYLFSFVATPAAPTSQEGQPTADSHPAETADEVNPTAEQAAVPSTPPAVAVQAATPQPVAAASQPPLPPAVASLAASPLPADGSPGRTRKGSVSSQSGWLNYLAFRASQKKLPNASTASIKSGKEKERKSLDEPEEVMDFSSDPNFPGSSGVSVAPSVVEGEASKNTVAAQSTSGQGMPTSKKSTQALAIAKGRRLSNGSTKSGNLTPLSSSPKIKVSPKTPSTSTLPGPSAAIPPAAQPNFVIPSFESTFDKPPRSLPPLPDNAGGTSALAWKAIGAVGSYVYGPGTDAKEGQGMREGRRVGSGLPRKVGLGEAKGGLGPDDGWKHVKRVVVVGVHGWFPAKMLNSVIGEPTGTSVKFANMMGASVKRFFDERGVNDIRLTLMPLEGEGTIESRVDRLYKAYLANPAWINDLRRADAIFFAAHSQGCIVTTHLISRLIAQGHIRTPYNGEAVARCEWAFGLVSVVPETTKKRGPILSGSDGGHQKVAMLAMCGVHLGPLYSISTSTVIQPYLQWFENAAARELFEFQDTTSAVGAAYQKSLAMILENEVKVVLLASYNDQVVPIYGASFSTATHPLLLRALFVDGASYAASDFMTNLLAFAFMLRNAGIDDQGLVEHLSEATAGSLTGVGHSAPYEDKGAYDLTVKYMFLSGPAKHPMPALHVEPFAARDVRSDFELPWIMRALVDSQEVRDLFPAELKDLREGVIGWKPVTKALKEIKKRLEPMAGRQSRLRHQSSTATLGEGVNGAAAGPTGALRSRL